MKFLIQNFSTNDSTLPLYIKQELQTDNYDSLLWSPKIHSLYDVLDKYQPNVFITHASAMPRDYIFYIKENNAKIELVLDVSNVSQKNLFSIEEELTKNNISCNLMFTHLDKHNLPITRKNRIISLLTCADINLETKINNVQFRYSVNKGIMTNQKEDITYEKFSYHTISNFEHLQSVVDIYCPIMELSTIYQNYDEMIFKNINSYIPQSFFDSLLFGNKTYYDVKEENFTTKTIDIIFKEFGSLNYNNPERVQDFAEIKKFILEKHAPANRLKSLLSQLSKN